jgi:hypothetical protein
MTSTSAYAGPERRRHLVFVTRNSEYHCRDGECVAVRNRRTNAFDPHHAALGRTIAGGILFNAKRGIVTLSNPGEPHIGEQLCFSARRPADDIVTSVLTAVERPPKDVVRGYRRAALWASN